MTNGRTFDLFYLKISITLGVRECQTGQPQGVPRGRRRPYGRRAARACGAGREEVGEEAIEKDLQEEL